MAWKEIEGYKYPYRVSDTGRIQSCYSGKWVDLSPSVHGKRKRLEITFVAQDGTKELVPVKYLVADAFMGGRRPGYNIIHKNGMKSDCAVENLAFANKHDTGKMYGAIGRRKAVLKLDRSGNLLAVYHSAKEAAKKNFMYEGQVKRHCRGDIQNPFKFSDFTFAYDK